jgi:hypothetical protein
VTFGVGCPLVLLFIRLDQYPLHVLHGACHPSKHTVGAVCDLWRAWGVPFALLFTPLSLLRLA